jgi:Lrp/AsnC family transcriptional regulator
MDHSGDKGSDLMDETDRKILTVIQADASLPVAEIARRVGLSSSPCWTRIQRMEASGLITGRVALLDPQKAGFGLTVFVSLEAGDHSPSWLARFTEAVLNMPEVLGAYRMAGEVDYLLHVVVPDIEAYDLFYKRLIGTALMKNVTSRFAMERVKFTTAYPV